MENMGKGLCKGIFRFEHGGFAGGDQITAAGKVECLDGSGLGAQEAIGRRLGQGELADGAFHEAGGLKQGCDDGRRTRSG